MKTLKSKLKFQSFSVIELEDSQMNLINGGSTTFFVDWIQGQIDEAMEEMSKWI